jgi:hypothetical protein
LDHGWLKPRLLPRACCDLDRLFAQIKRERGKLDIVFANAGIVRYAQFGKITEEHFDSAFSINVKGLFFSVQKALPLMPDGASIILNASIVTSKGLPTNSVYAASKAAVRSFARTWPRYASRNSARRIPAAWMSLFMRLPTCSGPANTRGLTPICSCDPKFSHFGRYRCLFNKAHFEPASHQFPAVEEGRN